MNDDDLKSVLDGWKPPEPPSGMGERTWARFEERRRPVWLRVLTCRLNVPFPAAAVAGLVLLMLGAVSGTLLGPRHVQVIESRPPFREPAPQKRHESQASVNLSGFQPLSEIKPQVIRRN